MSNAAASRGVRARTLPVGGGAGIFALYWMAGAMVLSMLSGLLPPLYELSEGVRTTLVAGHALLLLGWLGFVVVKATRGGTLVATPDALVVNKFLLPTRYELAGFAESVAFVSSSETTRYFLGPALVFNTREGKTVSVACLSQDIHEQLGLALRDSHTALPTVVVSPESFVSIHRLLVEEGRSSA